MSLADVKTTNGYPLDEVVSALQKEIRRGNEEHAMYWALEMCPTFENHLWNRLLVITHEDIGLAQIGLMTAIPAARESYDKFRAMGNYAYVLVLANAILMMCRSPKSRLADHFQNVMFQRRAKGLRIPIPDYAVDKHTKAGRQRGRGVDHWLEEGCQLNETYVEDQYEGEAAACWRAPVKTEPWPKPKNAKAAETDVQPVLMA